ncbi:ArsR/SmtB family transcription factor [Oryzibacter oryziterrae]|uniref:ArsR/SmtB family transcription factor n=1 Tax=Oryzibacter oryziterrae TaxID=2766474 RepID=UPI001EFF745B|nr:metalloregulator ArsR/SmtB family transcription factor [Oryzibacter oryziterrae]
MDDKQTIDALSALAQDTRLATFRLLVAAEPEGLTAGEIARQLDVPHNTLSTHLAKLAQAGLVTSERRSREIVYRASLERLGAVVNHLIVDCCGGHPELCAPLPPQAVSCCSPEDSHA